MKKCNNCGKPIGNDWHGMECDGVMSMAPDPYAEEIHGDYTEYWSCAGARYESSMDI